MPERLARPVSGLFAIVPAAGRGERLRSETGGRSKVFFELPTRLGPKPILALTLHALSRSGLFEGIVVATSPEERDLAVEIAAEIACSIEVIQGGDTRQETVIRALEALKGRATAVAIHDAARPFVTTRSLEDVVAAGLESGAALLVEPVLSTLKKVSEEGLIVSTLPREQYALAQTPQVFHFELIYGAHSNARKEGFAVTDDVQLVERLNLPVRAVPNNSPNPKVTTPSDLPLAQLLAAR